MKNREQFKNSIYEKRDRYYAERSAKRKKAIKFFAPITVCLVLCCAVLTLPLINNSVQMSYTEANYRTSNSSDIVSTIDIITSEASNTQIDASSETSDQAAASSKASSTSNSQTAASSENTDVSESQVTASSEPEGLSRGWFDEVSRVRNDSSSKDTGSDSKVMCAPLQIVSVKISTLPESEKYQRTYTSEDKIQTIINYLGNLELSQPSTNPDQCDGMSYIITFTYSDSTTITFVHFANKFLKINNDGWKEMNYDQAAKFEQIVSDLESD